MALVRVKYNSSFSIVKYFEILSKSTMKENTLTLFVVVFNKNTKDFKENSTIFFHRSRTISCKITEEKESSLSSISILCES